MASNVNAIIIYLFQINSYFSMVIFLCLEQRLHCNSYLHSRCTNSVQAQVYGSSFFEYLV